MKFGEHIKQLRELNHLLQRQLANALDMDTAMLSKIERGERRAKREHIPIFASLLNTNEKDLCTIWLADKVYELIKQEDNATEIFKVAEEQIKADINKHSSKKNVVKF
ncbi:helix-turn-helix transcriptional regulator [Flavobacterium sp.]|uniref:helix-turn-helix domain-containing protein n=1 Tax=Flavobacterium sp. TaxID=239 RepID=UPI002B9990D6|nr:helix-turn-helix transcriptional regulator [Flavobacterium sp.]HSD06507.1 helix-turn-helix transcriptional regulator [Flavobacterium sp.]